MNAGGQLDLNRLAAERQLNLDIKTAETVEEIQARLAREKEAADHQRKGFWAMFALLISLTIFAMLLLLASNDPSNKEWARNLLFAIGGGVAGYITGRKHTDQRHCPIDPSHAFRYASTDFNTSAMNSSKRSASVQRTTVSRSCSGSTQMTLRPRPSAKKLDSGALGKSCLSGLSHHM